jgi:hypothetical protein
MSVSEFSQALKNKAIKEWYLNEAEKSGAARPDSQKEKSTSQQAYTLDNINNIINVSSDYRATEQTAAKTSFIITKDTIAKLLVDLKGADSSLAGFNSLVDDTFKKFVKKGSGIKVNRKRITVGKDLPAVFFNSIAFDSITNLVNNILELQPKQLAEYYEKGHVISINTSLLKQTQDRIREIDTRGSSGKSLILNQLDKVIAYYEKLDIESANIQPAQEISVYASARKILRKTGEVRYLVELQPKNINQRSADEVKKTIGGIRKLFSPGVLSEKGMVSTIDKLLKAVSDPKFKKDLLELRSSPNLLDLMADQYANILVKNPIKDVQYTVPKVKISTVKVAKPNLGQLRQEMAKEKSKVKQLKTKISKKIPVVKAILQAPLISLQSLLDATLVQRIKQNMGSGNSRTVLNLRTGRLAESVKVERLSESRAGMITAFYSYMKNPYATFSDGGKQSSPRSRDPKLLISKSIREIAATQVGNRLRAVNV